MIGANSAGVWYGHVCASPLVQGVGSDGWGARTAWGWADTRGLGAGAMCYLPSMIKMGRCDPTAQPSAVRDHQPSEPTPRTSGSSWRCPWYRANRDSLPTAPKLVFTPPLVTVKHMIIPARGAGFGPEPPQGPRGVAPCPGFSAAHCWGA